LPTQEDIMNMNYDGQPPKQIPNFRLQVPFLNNIH
jgi:hypothetical protein